MPNLPNCGLSEISQLHSLYCIDFQLRMQSCYNWKWRTEELFFGMWWSGINSSGGTIQQCAFNAQFAGAYRCVSVTG